jgi:anti-anti-sigma factor
MAIPRIFCIEDSDRALVVKIRESSGTFIDDDVFREIDSIIEQYRADTKNGVIIDLVELEYFNSIILEALLRLWNHVHSSGAKMVVCNVSQVGLEILQISKLDSIWPVCDSREDAAQSVGN